MHKLFLLLVFVALPGSGNGLGVVAVLGVLAALANAAE